MIKLYGLEISGNTYKAQLMMSLLNIEYQFTALDVVNKEHKSKQYLALNPRGEFPVLVDGRDIIWDSQAILIYIASLHKNNDTTNNYYPDNAIDMAHINQWLSVANIEIFNSLGKARAIVKLLHKGDLNTCQKNGKQLLEWLNRHLKNRKWIATNKPSVADIACYPYVCLCEEGGVSLDGFDEIKQWFKDIQSLKNYIGMPGLFDK